MVESYPGSPASHSEPLSDSQDSRRTIPLARVISPLSQPELEADEGEDRPAEKPGDSDPVERVLEAGHLGPLVMAISAGRR